MHLFSIVEYQQRKYQPPPGPKCPLCKQKLRPRRLLMVWHDFRSWLVSNKEQVFQQLHERQAEAPLPTYVLTPDLEWALKAEAGYWGLEPSDMLNEIVDSYLVGRFELLKRRGRNRLDTSNISDPEISPASSPT